MRGILLFAASVLAAGPASAAIDLSGWTAAGAGWVLGSGNTSVTQTLNGGPSVFYSPVSARNKSFAGKVSVRQTGDNDYFGFVFGFNAGELSNPGNFGLIDWRQGPQTALGCTATTGMALSQVSNGLGSNNGGWCHSGFGVTELARGATLGNVGWTDPRTYTFELTYTNTGVRFSLDGVQQFNQVGDFSDGAFGFYSFSQRGVTFSDLTVTATAVPEPTSWALMIAGLGLVGGTMRARRTKAVLAQA